MRMFMTTLMIWCAFSVPVTLAVGRALAGPAVVRPGRATSPAADRFWSQVR